MPDPMNYVLANVPNPMQSVMQGIQSAYALRAMSDEQKMRQSAMQAENEKRQREQMFKEDASMLYEKPTLDQINKIITKYPEYAARFDKVRTSLSDEQKRVAISKASEVFTSALKGNSEVTINLMTKQIDAARNAGKEDEAKALETMKATYEKDPRAFVAPAALYLAQAMGEKDFAANFKALLEQSREEAQLPAKTKEAEAKAQKAAIDAKYAESEAVAALRKKGVETEKLQNDIVVATENAKVARWNAAIAAENNSIKRQEMQVRLEEAKRARDEKIMGRASEYETAQTNANNMLDTIDRILNTPKNVVNSATGAIGSRMPTMFESTANFESLVENLSSQAFLNQVNQMRGLGALSENEGKKIQAALQNLSLKQGPGQLLSNVKKIKDIVDASKRNLDKKYGMSWDGKIGTPKSEVYEVDF